MSDDDLRRQLARQARADSLQYDIRAITERVIDLFGQAIESYRLRTQTGRG